MDFLRVHIYWIGNILDEATRVENRVSYAVVVAWEIYTHDVWSGLSGRNYCASSLPTHNTLFCLVYFVTTFGHLIHRHSVLTPVRCCKLDSVHWNSQTAMNEVQSWVLSQVIVVQDFSAYFVFNKAEKHVSLYTTMREVSCFLWP